MHILRGNHRKPGLCIVKCKDPICDYGCLRQLAKLAFRADIMHGVEIARNNGDPRFPFIVPANSIEHCIDGYLCKDSTCQVVGCMSKPGYIFRNLIKMAHNNKIIKALKK